MRQPQPAELDALFDESINTIDNAKALGPLVIKASIAMATALRAGNKILICGNGGSAADSLHFSGELLNKFFMVRRPLAAICLAADVSTLTSIGNDESFDAIFSKQVDALGKPGDVLVAFTSSGNSPSIVRAAQAAAEHNMLSIALNGRDGGALSPLLQHDDIDIVVPHQKTARIQEVHGIIIHAFCQFIDQQLFGES